MIPGIGFVADVANGIWYCAEGRYFEAAGSFVSAIPGAGDAIGLAAKGITGCSKASKAIRYVAGLTGKVGNFALGAYSTGSQICSMWDKYVIRGESWGPDSWKELVGVSFSGFSTVSSVKGIAADISNYSNVKHDIVTSQCFVEGTLVLTDNGQKPIEEIKQGDHVYASDPETGESGYKEVVQTFENETEELVHIFANGDEIVSTPKHPFYVPQKGWTSAVDLRAGDMLVLSNGEYVIVEQVQHEILETPVKVYNFEVQDFHTYYVGKNSVLVHNKCKRSEVQRKKWEEYTGTQATGEVHHGLPEKYSKWFSDRGLDINSGEYYYDLPKSVHRLRKGNGIHTKKSPLGEEWNSIWKTFKTEKPNATRDDILYQLWHMEKTAGISQYRAIPKR